MLVVSKVNAKTVFVVVIDIDVQVNENIQINKILKK